MNGAASGWQLVASSVPQGSVLESVLSNIFINDLEAGVEYILSKFADNTKLAGAANSLEGQEILQRDLDTLEHWAISNGMKFSKGKCQVPQLEWSNAGHSYRLEDGWLENSFAERDLRVLLDSKLNTSQMFALTIKGQTAFWGASNTA